VYRVFGFILLFSIASSILYVLAAMVGSGGSSGYIEEHIVVDMTGLNTTLRYTSVRDNSFIKFTEFIDPNSSSFRHVSKLYAWLNNSGILYIDVVYNFSSVSNTSVREEELQNGYEVLDRLMATYCMDYTRETSRVGDNVIEIKYTGNISDYKGFLYGILDGMKGYENLASLIASLREPSLWSLVYIEYKCYWSVEDSEYKQEVVLELETYTSYIVGGGERHTLSLSRLFSNISIVMSNNTHYTSIAYKLPSKAIVENYTIGARINNGVYEWDLKAGQKLVDYSIVFTYPLPYPSTQYYTEYITIDLLRNQFSIHVVSGLFNWSINVSGWARVDLEEAIIEYRVSSSNKSFTLVIEYYRPGGGLDPSECKRRADRVASILSSSLNGLGSPVYTGFRNYTLPDTRVYSVRVEYRLENSDPHGFYKDYVLEYLPNDTMARLVGEKLFSDRVERGWYRLYIRFNNTGSQEFIGTAYILDIGVSFENASYTLPVGVNKRVDLVGITGFRELRASSKAVKPVVVEALIPYSVEKILSTDPRAENISKASITWSIKWLLEPGNEVDHLYIVYTLEKPYTPITSLETPVFIPTQSSTINTTTPNTLSSSNTETARQSSGYTSSSDYTLVIIIVIVVVIGVAIMIYLSRRK